MGETMNKRQYYGFHWIALSLALLGGLASAGHELEREYVVPGTLAWEAASQSGFTFRIQYGHCVDGQEDAKCVPDGGFSAEPNDGYKTRLGLAHYDAGTMVVEQFASGSRNPRSYVFELFGTKELGDGWEIKSVELLGSYVVEEMEFRTDGPSEDAMFKVRIYESRTEQRSASIKTMTLIGPPGADWRNAFRTGED